MKNISLLILITVISFSVIGTFGQTVPLSTSVANPSCGDATGTLYISQQYCSGCTITKWEAGIMSSPVSATNPHGVFTPKGTYPGSTFYQYSVQAPGAIAYRAYYTQFTNGPEYQTFPLEVRADVINVMPLAGIVSDSVTYLTTAPPVRLTLTGSFDTSQWFKSDNLNGFNPVSITLPLDGTVNLTESTWFKATVTKGACVATSNIIGLEIFKTGVLSGPSSVPEGDRVTLTLTQNNKNIIQWEYSTNGGTNWVIFDYNSYGKTISNDTFADTHRITGNTMFRVLVDVGPYGHRYTNTIAVSYLPYTRYYAPQVNGGNYVREQQVVIPGITTPNAVEGLASSQKHEVITYLDGTGRSLQQNIRKASPNAQNDIISASVYDHQGRQTTQYLPYVSSGNDGAYRTNPLTEQTSFYANGTTDKIADSPYPYSQTIYEKSPIGRVLEQGSVGAEFQLYSSHTQRIGYSTNVANEVRLFNADGSSSAFYPANQLYKTETIDPDQKKTQTFKDKAGHTILSRMQLDDNITINGTPVFVPWLETYYIYTIAGTIKYIISPKGVYALQGGSWTLTPSILNQYVHQFTYDSLGRLVEKKVPGQVVMYYCYDRFDRIVLTQDGNARGANQWLFLKYDFKGRPVMQGLYTNTTYTTRASLQTNVIDPLYALDTDLYYEERGAAAHGYTNNSFPTTGTQVQSVNYYDNYDLDNNGTDDLTYTPQNLIDENIPTTNTLGMATVSKRIVLDGGNAWLYSYAFYDVYGRMIQGVTNNHLSTAVDNITTMVYDFAGNMKLTKSYHNAGTGKHTTVVNTFVYDVSGRLKQVRQNNNQAASDQLVAQYEYNELGQLVDKRLHYTGDGSNPVIDPAKFLQSIDYRYNLQGRLTSINNAQLTNDAQINDDTNDMFGMELLYQNAEGGLNTGLNETCYNGNISAVKWKGVGATAGVANQKSYKFTYDKSDRLKGATSQLYNGNTWTKESGALNESMSYDHNGNILTLQRNQRRYLPGVVPAYSTETIDDLTYSYDPAMGDQLQKVTDAASGTAAAGFNNGTSGTANDYVYDVNGNVIKDLNKGISNIVYNHLGMPITITFSDGRHVDYLYDAAGSKLTMKTYSTTNVLKTTTDYVNGFVYENNTLSFFGSPEGRVVNKNGTLEYQYAITDHQGNARVIFTSAAPAPQTVTATFENASESSLFTSYPSGAGISPMPTNNHTKPVGTESQHLNGGANGMVGVSNSYKVYPGDQVKIEAYARYDAPSNNSNGLTGFAAALLSAFNVPAPVPGEAGTASSALYNFGSLAAGGFGDGTRDTIDAKAFVNILLFDKNYNFLDVSYAQVNSTGAPAYITANYTVKEEGYVFMYISNENTKQTDVYFDDVTMTYTPTNIIQYSEYYPFGLAMNTSWTRDNTIGNNFLSNGGSELNTTTGYMDLPYRNLDASIGRFMQVDPMAQENSSISPFAFALNNPVYYNDPSGLIQASEQQIKDFIRQALAGSGGFWGSSGGPEYFKTDYQAFIAGVDYNDHHDSWGNTEAGSFEQAAKNYTQETCDVVFLRRIEIRTTRYADYGTIFSGEAYWGNDWLGMRLNEATFDYAEYADKEATKIVKFVNEFNPIANAWDAYSGFTNGTDRFGNPLSTGGAIMEAASIIPITKVFSMLRNGYVAAKGGVALSKGGESFFRAMSKAEYAALESNGGLTHMPGKELFVSTEAAYSRAYLEKSGYDVLVKFEMKPGAMNYFNEVGVFHRTAAGSSGWAARGSLLWKSEQGVMNLGIQQNTHMFNPWILNFTPIP